VEFSFPTLIMPIVVLHDPERCCVMAAGCTVASLRTACAGEVAST